MVFVYSSCEMVDKLFCSFEMQAEDGVVFVGFVLIFVKPKAPAENNECVLI